MPSRELTRPLRYDAKVIDHVRQTRPVMNVRWYLFFKRIFDYAITLVSSPIWILLLGLCWVLIKIESPRGSAIFSQMRTGKNGRRFIMYKFRTMLEDAENLKTEIEHLNELQFPDFKILADPRVTRVGHFLRKTSLDELPQLINVLLGNMSLVGPRPTSFSPDSYLLWQTERLDVMPGITGLWQLVGRGTTEFEERLRLDIHYIKHKSLYVDGYILFHTIRAVIKKRGAY